MSVRCCMRMQSPASALRGCWCTSLARSRLDPQACIIAFTGTAFKRLWRTTHMHGLACALLQALVLARSEYTFRVYTHQRGARH